MKRIVLCAILIAASVAAFAADTLEGRANRAYAAGDWPQVKALYAVLAARNPAEPSYTARMILAAELMNDTLTAPHALSEAMSHGASLDKVLGDIETDSYTLGNGTLYPRMLVRLDREMPYMRRAWALRLMKVYSFRGDHERVIEYASRLFNASMPDAPQYLNILAQAHLELGHYDEAERSYRAALQADADNFDALVGLGTLLCAFNNDKARTTEGLAMLQRARAIRSTPYLDTLTGH